MCKGRRAEACALILAVLALTTACVPIVTPIYRPAAPGGEILGAHCPPEPRSVIRFNRRGVLVSAKASYQSNDGIWVQVTFELPEGTTVRLLDHVVEVSIDSRAGYTGQLAGERISQADAVQPGAPMHGATIEHELELSEGWPTQYDPPEGIRARTRLASYWFQAHLSVPRADVFTLKLPRFTVNDGKVELPVITFTRHMDFYVAPMNC